MEFSELMTRGELSKFYKETFGQTFSPDDDELLLDAFRHGPYHEEEFFFELLAQKLSDRELASIFLPVAHLLIASTAEVHPDVQALYIALSEWQNQRLKDPQKLIGSLGRVRKLVLSSQVEPAASKADAIAFFKVLELGILDRLGFPTFELRSRYC
jgi:hypothetical protein